MAAPENHISDDDVAMYWTVLAATDAEVPEHIAASPQSSEAAAFAAAHSSDDPEWLLGGLYRNVAISDTTFDKVRRSDDTTTHQRVALFTNPHHGQRVSDMWDELTELERHGAIHNPALDPRLLADQVLRYRDEVAQNPATPTDTLLALHHRSGDRTPASKLLAHPNAPKRWVLDALARPGLPDSLLALESPQLTDAELRTCAHIDIDAAAGTVEGYPVWAAAVDMTANVERFAETAAEVLARRQRRGTARRVEELRVRHPIKRWFLSEVDAEIVGALRDIGDTHREAAAALVRSGFGGTIDELLKVATTFN